MKSKNETEKQNEDKEQNPDYQKKESVLRGLYHITGKACSKLITIITKTLLVTGFAKLNAVMPIESQEHCQ